MEWTTLVVGAFIVSGLVGEAFRVHFARKAKREKDNPRAGGPYRTPAADWADPSNEALSKQVMKHLIEVPLEGWQVMGLKDYEGTFLHVPSGISCYYHTEGLNLQVTFEGDRLPVPWWTGRALAKRIAKLHKQLLDRAREDKWRRALKSFPCLVLALWLTSGCPPTASSSGPCAVHERRCNEGNFVEICDTAGHWRKVLDCNAVESELWKSWSCQLHLGVPTCLPTPDGGAR